MADISVFNTGDTDPPDLENKQPYEVKKDQACTDIREQHLKLQSSRDSFARQSADHGRFPRRDSSLINRAFIRPIILKDPVSSKNAIPSKFPNCRAVGPINSSDDHALISNPPSANRLLESLEDSRRNLLTLRDFTHRFGVYAAFNIPFSRLSASLHSTSKIYSHARLRPALSRIKGLLVDHEVLQSRVTSESEGLELLFWRLDKHRDKNMAAVKAGITGAEDRWREEAEADCREIETQRRESEMVLGEVRRGYVALIMRLRAVTLWTVSMAKEIVREQERREA